jgi:hypothetical protein
MVVADTLTPSSIGTQAPLEVVCILKELIEDGELALADGRQIVRDASDVSGTEHIALHPEFHAILLANRPGFPFLVCNNNNNNNNNNNETKVYCMRMLQRAYMLTPRCRCRETTSSVSAVIYSAATWSTIQT